MDQRPLSLQFDAPPPPSRLGRDGDGDGETIPGGGRPRQPAPQSDRNTGSTATVAMESRIGGTTRDPFIAAQKYNKGPGAVNSLRNGAPLSEPPLLPSLAEQMNITEAEIGSRKQLFDITPDDEDTLRGCSDVIERNVEQIVKTLCFKLQQFPEFYRFIGDRDTYDRWIGALKIYIRELFNGTYESSYVTQRLLIGKFQHKFNIPPKYYMAGFHILQDLLGETIRRDAPGPTDRTQKRLAALQKIILLDAHFILDAYTKMVSMEVDVARSEVRSYVEDLERRAKELSVLSRSDELTGLMNRRAFIEEARRAINMAQRSRHPLSMVYFDLDGFKAVNDSRGHLAGDDVLRRVSEAIYKSLRETDIACRYGGDEFILLLPSTEADMAKLVCKRLYSTYSPAGAGDVDFSFGIAQLGPRTFATVDEAIRLADDMMYKAKSERGNGKSLRIHIDRFGE